MASKEKIAHSTEHDFAANAITQHPKPGGDKGAHKLQGSKQSEQENRAGLNQDVPAQNNVFHLEGPGRAEIGRPLKTVAPDFKSSERSEIPHKLS